MKRQSFTVIELLVVISIIAILAAMLMPAFMSGMENAKINDDVQLITNLSAACQKYRENYGDYPPSSGTWDADFVKNGSANPSLTASESDIKYASALLLKAMLRTTRGSPVFVPPAKNIKTEGSLSYLVDHNGLPLLYSHCRDYLDSAGNPWQKIRSSVPVAASSNPTTNASDNLLLDYRQNPNSFQLIAPGKDKFFGGAPPPKGISVVGREKDNLTNN